MPQVRAARTGALLALLAALLVVFASGSGRATAAGTPGSPGYVIAAAGDIACDPLDPNFGGGSLGSDCQDRATSDLIVNAGVDAVLPLGDNQYYCGSYSAHQQSYANTWGRLKSKSHPAVGNHEYLTVGGSIFGGTGCDASNAGAAGHWDYWNGVGNFSGPAGDRDKGYYSYDIGNWHLVALNSQCSAAGGCGPSSPQVKWLTADLAAHKTQCTAAYWHIPFFSSGGRASTSTSALWDALYAGGAELVLSGHDHLYERFAPQRTDGTLDPGRGIRQFVVGTGGSNHTSVQALAPNSQAGSSDTFGVLFLTLGATGYEWRFAPEPGRTFTDSGSAACHPGAAVPSDTSAPSSPTNLAATTQSSKQVDLTWSGSTDQVGVSGYTVYREGSAIANVGPGTRSYSDTGLSPGTRYHYTVDAFDETGNRSSKSNSAAARTFNVATFQFTPVADAYVDAGRPTTNLGTAANLRTTTSPEVISYLRFDLSGLEKVLSAKLRVLPTTSASSQGFAVRGAGGSWTESSVTYATRPTLGAVGGMSGQVKKKVSWQEVDVTSLVTQAGPQSLALTARDANLIDYASRESGANAPQLVVTGETSTPPIQTLSFGAAADTYVDASRASSAFGSAATLKTGASPELTSYARFNLANVGTAIKSAKLRVVPKASNATGFQVRGVGSTTWGETTTTYATRPASGAVAASSGALTSNTVKEVDVTSLVTGDGALSVSLTSTNAGSVDYASREAGASGPRLVVTSEVPPADTQKPSVPTLTAATAATPKRIDLSWSASTDNVGVGGYTIYRNGAPLLLVGPDTLSYQDTDVQPDTQYTYAVDAFDADGNRSQQSSSMSATTPSAGTFTFAPAADTYVDAASPAATFGSSPVLRTDASPEVLSYLRFDVGGLGQSVLSAKLRVFANAANAVGFDVRGVPSSSLWSEATTYDSRPAAGAVAGSSGPTTAGAWSEVDVTSLVTGNGQVGIALTSTSTANVNYASREAGATAPQLIVEAQVPSADPTPPTPPTLTGATAINSRRVDLTWTAGTDNVGIASYAIRRNGAEAATVGASTLSYTDTTVSPGGTYSYTVEALDAAGNRSGESNALSVTTPSVTTAPFTAAADTFVDASNTSATFGVSAQLRTDASPVVMSYLRFNLAGLGATVVRARLRVFANSGNGVGYDVRGVSDSLWGETTTSYDSRPAIGAVAGSSGPAAAGTWTEVDVTSLVTGDGPLSLAITSTSATNATYASRETGANAPQLLVETY